MVLIAVWKGIGYNIILFFAGLQGISADMYEAAEIDGANAFKRWLYITIPASKNTFTFVIMTSTIAALKRFTEIYAVSRETGNPAGKLETIMLYIYKNSFSSCHAPALVSSIKLLLSLWNAPPEMSILFFALFIHWNCQPVFLIHVLCRSKVIHFNIIAYHI